jgi:hypothetical protein
MASHEKRADAEAAMSANVVGAIRSSPAGIGKFVTPFE